MKITKKCVRIADLQTESNPGLSAYRIGVLIQSKCLQHIMETFVISSTKCLIMLLNM